jgi:hypothetical protein
MGFSRWVALTLVIVAGLFAGVPARGAEQRSAVTVTPAPAWVDPRPADDFDAVGVQPSDGLQPLLFDVETRAVKEQHWRFVRS